MRLPLVRQQIPWSSSSDSSDSSMDVNSDSSMDVFGSDNSWKAVRDGAKCRIDNYKPKLKARYLRFIFKCQFHTCCYKKNAHFQRRLDTAVSRHLHIYTSGICQAQIWQQFQINKPTLRSDQARSRSQSGSPLTVQISPQSISIRDIENFLALHKGK